MPKRRKGKNKRIGELDKYVKLQTFADAISGTSSLTGTFSDVASIWANISQLSGIAADRFKNLGSNFTHTITIKYRDGISSENWIEYDGNNYRVRTVQDLGDEKKRQLLLMCELSTKKDVYANPNTEDSDVTENEFLPT